MVCEELDQLEWDFIQARAGSLDIDSLGWTRVFGSALISASVVRVRRKPIQTTVPQSLFR